MKKTLDMMKKSGLFDSLVENIMKKDMPKEAVAVAIDHVCELDENFEHTFFNDIHNFGVDIIWNELSLEASCRMNDDMRNKQQKDLNEIQSLLNEIIGLLENM